MQEKQPGVPDEQEHLVRVGHVLCAVHDQRPDVEPHPRPALRPQQPVGGRGLHSRQQSGTLSGLTTGCFDPVFLIRNRA